MGQIKNIKLHIVTDIKWKLHFIHHSARPPAFSPIRMQFPLSMMHDSIWVDRLHYIEAEEHIHLKNSVEVSSFSSSLVNEITAMRNNINSCVLGMTSTSIDGKQVEKLEQENRSLKKLIEELSKQVGDLTLRVGKLEGNVPPTAPEKEKGAAQKQEEDEDDFELFGSDDEEEEET